MLKYIKKINGVYYFTKRIHRKYLTTHDKDIMFSKSLKVACSNYYHLLKNDNDFSKLGLFLNDGITIYMKHKKKLELQDIVTKIHELSGDYYSNAIIENSELELKRIEALEYTNENGIQQGYSIQALSREYKKVSDQYDNMHNTEKTVEIGSQILKRSNITKEEILDIPPKKIVMFYEMLIKAERSILENDIKLYISRNLHQFASLITNFNQDQNSKIESAYYAYLDIVRKNEPQVDYLNFLQKLKKAEPAEILNKDDLIKELFAKIKEDETEKVLNTTASIEALRDRFFEFKNYSSKRKLAATNAIRFLIEFLAGNGKDYKAINISDLTTEDVFVFEKLLTEVMPRTKSKELRSLNIFELVEKRKRENNARYGTNTAVDIESYIKVFWRYLCKYHKNLGLQQDTMEGLEFKYQLIRIKEETNTEDPSIRAFNISEIKTFLQETYSGDKLKKMLLSSPRNYFLFILGLLTGMRHEESLLIKMSDIKIQYKNGVNYYYIYLNEDQPYQHLKNTNAHRNIPITNLMKELGLLSYINVRHRHKKETLFDFPKNASTSANAFFSRHIQKLFPDFADTRSSRNLHTLKDYIHFRSLRKNFIKFLYSKNVSENYTDLNIKKIIGHDTSTTGRYYGRIEPFVAFEILNNVDFESEINFSEIKQTIKSYYKEVLFELSWMKDSRDDWNKVSKVKSKKGRKV